MAKIADVVHAYIAAWHELDESARQTLLANVWRENGLYQDPSADIHGRAKLLPTYCELSEAFSRMPF